VSEAITRIEIDLWHSGVRAAMPGFIGKKLCPELVFVRPNFEKYTAVAEIIRTIVREYDPNFKSHSLDEVYMDLTEAARKRWMHQRSNRTGTTTAMAPASSAPLISKEEANGAKVHNLEASSIGVSLLKEGAMIDIIEPVTASSSINLLSSLPPSNDDSHLVGAHKQPSPSDRHCQHQRPISPPKPPGTMLFDSCYLKQNKLPVNNLTSASTAPTPSSQSLDIPIEELREAACAVLQEIRNRITDATGGLTCSAGR
jgi:nucleotidyltransferase/DNA polymerase involved in DNA repair